MKLRFKFKNGGKIRDSLDIIYDFLTAAAKPSLAVQIRRRARINGATFSEYLHFLFDAGLINYDKGRYVATEKAAEYRRLYNEYTRGLRNQTQIHQRMLKLLNIDSGGDVTPGE